MKVFIFYSAHLEIEKDIQEREKLTKQIEEVDKRLNVRNGLVIGLLKGIIESSYYNEKNTSDSEVKLLSGGETMRFQGISIFKHKNCDTWYARYRKNGKQFYLSANTQKECYEKLKKALSQKAKQEIKQLQFQKESSDKTVSFIDWYKKWLELYKHEVKKTTILDYKSSLNYLKEIYDIPMNKINGIKILEILNDITFERRRQKVYEILKDIFKRAHDNKIIQDNPIDAIEKPKHKKVNGIPFTNNDERILEEYLVKNKLYMFLICLYQGLRRGEVLGLTEENVDLINNTLTINKGFSICNEFTTAKNEYSERTMPIFKKSKPIFEKVIKQGRLFPVSYSWAGALWEKIKNELFPDSKYTMHSFRHTFVTKCQECKIPLHVIQNWVGHNIGSLVTNQVYTHLRKDAEVENIEKFNRYSIEN